MSPRRTIERRPEQRTYLSCPITLWLAEPSFTKRKGARAALSRVVASPTPAVLAHADKANRGQSSAFKYRAHNHSGCLCPGRPSEQWPEQRPLHLCKPKQWQSDPTPTERRLASARQHISCLPPQWLAKPTPAERTEAREAPTLTYPPPQWLAKPKPNELTET
jgi:hypothetical protein